MILLSAELAGRHVEVRALFVVFFAQIVGRIGDEIELLVGKIRPVLAFEAVFVKPHEGRILGNPRIETPVGGGGVSLTTATEVDGFSGLAIGSKRKFFIKMANLSKI